MVEIVKFLPKHEISQKFNARDLNDHTHHENDIVSIRVPKRDTLSEKIIFMILPQFSCFFTHFEVAKIFRKTKFNVSSNVPEICVD